MINHLWNYIKQIPNHHGITTSCHIANVLWKTAFLQATSLRYKNGQRGDWQHVLCHLVMQPVMRPRWEVPDFLLVLSHFRCFERVCKTESSSIRTKKKTCWKWDGNICFAEFRQAEGCSVSLSCSINIVASCSLPFQVLHCITWQKTTQFICFTSFQVWYRNLCPCQLFFSSPHNGINLDPVDVPILRLFPCTVYWPFWCRGAQMFLLMDVTTGLRCAILTWFAQSFA